MTETTITNKLDIRPPEGVTTEQIAAALTTPPAQDTRLKGTDVILCIFKGAVLQDKLTLIKDISVTIGRHGLIEFTAHQDGPALLDFLDDLRKAPHDFQVNVQTVHSDGQFCAILFKGVELDHFKMTAASRYEMVDARITIRAETVDFLR